MENTKYRVFDGERVLSSDEANAAGYVVSPAGQLIRVVLAHPTHAIGPLFKVVLCPDAKILFFTGLQDADGVDIYEGDVLRQDGEFTYGVDVFLPFDGMPVEWSTASAAWRLGNGGHYGGLLNAERAQHVRVVGNIYEQQEA